MIPISVDIYINKSLPVVRNEGERGYHLRATVHQHIRVSTECLLRGGGVIQRQPRYFPHAGALLDRGQRGGAVVRGNSNYNPRESGG